MSSISKIQEAGNILKHFCEEEGYQFLWEKGGLDHGFLDGGCKLLADAIMSVKESVLKDRNIFFVGRSAPGGSVDHVAVGFWVDDRWMFLDANGLQTENELIENLRNELNLSERMRKLEVDFFDEFDDDFMAKVEDSGFALYPDLDIIRKELVKKLHDIGFVRCIETSDDIMQNRKNFFTSSERSTTKHSNRDSFPKI